jgi:hypothetical protein
MPIHHVGNAGNISGYSEQNQNHFSDDSSEAEQQIMEFLLEHFELTELQARKTLALLIRYGEDIRKLALGIQNGEGIAIDQIALYIP